MSSPERSSEAKLVPAGEVKNFSPLTAEPEIIRFPIDPPTPWAPDSGHGDYLFALTNIDYYIVKYSFANHNEAYFNMSYIRHNTRWRHHTQLYMHFFSIDTSGNEVREMLLLSRDMPKDNNWVPDSYKDWHRIDPAKISQIKRIRGGFNIFWNEVELK